MMNKLAQRTSHPQCCSGFGPARLRHSRPNGLAWRTVLINHYGRQAGILHSHEFQELINSGFILYEENR